MRRDIEQRAKETMPFLTFDHDPYLAVTEEGYVWIMDAYTTSDAYPYSQAVNLAEVTAELLPRQEVNYIRNSVKVVVDAYDGTVTYYADLDEPIMQAWDRAFPGVFTSIDVAPDGDPRPFPLPREPLPDPGVPVRELPRGGSGRLLPEAGLLGDPGRPHHPERRDRAGRVARSGIERPEAAPELSAAAAARRGRGAVPSHDPVRAREPPQPGGVDGGELRPGRVRGARRVHAARGPGRRRTESGVLPHQLRPGVLRGSDAARQRAGRRCSSATC